MLDSPKLKEFADDNPKFDENGRKFSKRVKTLWEKEKLLQAIFPFPTVFSKDLYCSHVKIRPFWEKVYPLPDDKILALSKLKTFADDK